MSEHIDDDETVYDEDGENENEEDDEYYEEDESAYVYDAVYGYITEAGIERTNGELITEGKALEVVREAMKYVDDDDKFIEGYYSGRDITICCVTNVNYHYI